MRRTILFSFLLFLCCKSFSEPINAHSLILSGNFRQSYFTDQRTQFAYGLESEYFFSNRFSVRGGLMLSQDYVKITPAPLMWYLIDVVTSGSGSGYRHNGGSHGGHGCSGGHGGGAGCGRGCLLIMASLIIADGFAYDIPLDKKIEFTPYFTPWELEFSMSQGKEEDICAVGAGLNIAATKHIVCKTDIEYNRTALLADSKEGYSFNFSIGYKFLRKQ